MSMPRKKTHNEYVSELALRHPNLECLDVYVNGSTKLRFRCSSCGYERLATPLSVLASKKGCPKCAKNLPHTTESFVERLSGVTRTISVLGEYRGANEKLLVRCETCGNKWMAKPAALLRGHGCPACVYNQTSYIEQLIRWTFSCLYGEGEVISRDKTAIGEELDIYVPAISLAVEPGSWEYGHSLKVDTDARKRKKCREQGIRLITVYDSYTGEAPPFEHDCLVYKQDLGQASRELEWAAIGEMLALAGIEWAPSEEQRVAIENSARESCRRRSHEEFVAELKEKSPGIVLIGRYTGAKKKVRVQCRICGHEWNVDPYSITHGVGCPACGRAAAASHRAMAPEDFAARIARENPTVSLRGTFHRGAERIEVECRKCGHVWSPRAYSLIGKHPKACPHCGAVKAGMASRGMTEQGYVAKLATNNPGVELVGKYAGSKMKTEFRCKTCGKLWLAAPYSVLQGHGCPNWRNH